MLITRYELSIDDSERTVGLITGGWALGLLSDNDLDYMNKTLKVPQLESKNKTLSSYFTEEGLVKFANLIKTAEKNAKNKEQFEFHIKKMQLEISLNNKRIVYKDKWQVVLEP
jgi:hypothetical protein